MTKNIEAVETIVEDKKIVEVEKKNPYALFNMDANLEEEGIFIDYGLFRVKVARIGGNNTKYNKEMLKLSKKYNAASMKRMSDDQSAKLLNELYVKTIVKGWEIWDEEKKDWFPGIHSFPDNEVAEASFDNIINVFANFTELRLDIIQKASDKDNYIKEEVVKN